MSFFELTELDACRAREFSEAVALLGSHRQIGPELIALMQEIRRLRSLRFVPQRSSSDMCQKEKPTSHA